MERPWIVHQQGRARLSEAGEPVRCLGRVLVRGLETVHERRVRHGGSQRRDQIHGPVRGRERAPALRDRGRRGLGRRLGQAGRPEVHGELQLAAVPHRTAPFTVGTARRSARHAARDPGPRRPSARYPRRRDAALHRAERLGRVHRRLARERRQAIDERPELELAEETDHLGPVVVGEPGRLQVERDRQVADYSGQLAAGEYLLSRLHELLAQRLLLDLVETAVHLLQRAELADQFRGGLLPHSGDAGDVVGGVALESLVVDHLVRPQLEPLPDLRRVVVDRRVDTLARRHQAGVLGHDLEHVQVAGDDRGFDAASGVQVARDRADHVVRLEAGHLVDRDPKGRDNLANLRELRAQVVRHRRASGLVGGELLVAEGGAGEIEACGHVLRPEVLDPSKQDAAEAEDGVYQLALARRQRRQSVVAAVDEAVAVEQHQSGHAALERTSAGGGQRRKAARRLPIRSSVPAARSRPAGTPRPERRLPPVRLG